MKIGVQLYTLRSLMEQDLWGTLEKLAKVGFKNVELAGLYGRTPQEWRSRLDTMGLTVSSSHTGLAEVEADAAAVAGMAKTLGFKYVICPWIGEDVYAGGWNAVGRRMDAAGRLLQDHDIQFGYHNHDFEMVKVDAKTGLEHLFAASSGVNVVAEIDCFWIQAGGGSPAEYIQNLSGRIPLAHFKDMGDDKKFTEVGKGILDWDDIIESCRAAGVEHAIIENDNPQIDPLESVTISREFMLSKGLAD